METSLFKEDRWYQALISDLKQLNFEGIVATKHAIGKRILEDELKFGKAKYGEKTIDNLAQDLDCDRSDLFRCVQFAKKIPELSTIGQQLSWREIRRKLLPEAPHVSQATGENEWYTPPEFIEAARKTMGSIDCDPASSNAANEIVKADTFFTKENDGRIQKWHGNIWMNPPYSQPLVVDFCRAIVEKHQSGQIDQACVLVNNATETGWFQDMLEVCTCVCFPRKRVRFLKEEGEVGSPLQR